MFRFTLIKAIKIRIMRLVMHVNACKRGREKRNTCKILAVNLKGGDHLNDLAVDGIRRHCILHK